MSLHLKRPRTRASKLGIAVGVVVGVLASMLAVSPSIATADSQQLQAGAAHNLSALSSVAPVMLAGASSMVPREPTELFLEDFENMGAAAPAMGLESYVGAGGMTYTADPGWLDQTQCNGLLLRYKDEGTPCPIWRSLPEINLRRMADVLGQHALGVNGGTPETPVNSSSPESQNNHALAAFTFNTDLGDSEVLLKTNSPISLALGRFVTASVDIAETSCDYREGVNQSRLDFYLLDGGEKIPLQSEPIRACADGEALSYTSPTLPPPDLASIGQVPYADPWAGGGSYVNAATYYSNGSFLMGNNGPVGLELRNATASSAGNDAAIDNIRLVDVTPSLYKEFSAADTAKRSTLTFTVMNTSELAAKPGWSFNDAIDPALAIDPASAKTTCTAGSVSFSGQQMSVSGDLDAGQESCEITVSVTAKSVGTYTNCPGVNVTDLVGLLAPECATLKVGDYTFTKSSDPVKGTDVVPGQTVRYTLTATSTASSPDGAVVPISVHDLMGGVLDDAVFNDDFVASSGSAAVLPNGDIEWKADLVAPGTATLSYSVTLLPTPNSGDHALQNFVINPGDTPPSLCEPSSEKCTQHRILVPELSVAKSADPATGTRITRGDTVKYTVVAANTGETALSSVTVTDDLADVLDDAEIVSGSLAASTGAVPTVAGNTLTWSGDLALGEKVTLSYEVRVRSDAAGTATLRNTVIGLGEVPGGSTVPSNCVTGDEPKCTTSHPLIEPSISITKDDGKTVVRSGETLDYVLTATNSGTVNANDVVVTDALPTNVDFVKSSIPATQSVTDAFTFEWNLGTLKPGESREIVVTVKVHADLSADTDIVNTAKVTSSGACTDDPATAVNECEATDTDSTPSDVWILKDDHETEVKVGEELTYDLTVGNNSVTKTVTDAVVTDVLPKNVTFVSASDGGALSQDGKQVTWKLGDLAPGATITVQVTVKVKASVKPGDAVVNGASVDIPGGCIQEDACKTSDRDVVPKLGITKTDKQQTTKPGEKLTYDVTVTNMTDVDAEKIVVTDKLPANVEYVASSDKGSYDRATHSVTWSLGTIAGNAVKTVNVTVKVKADASDQIVNTASVKSPKACVLPGDCEATDETLIDPPLEMSPFAPLATTGGAGYTGIVGAAVLLLAAGAGLVVARRRRVNL